MRCFRPTRETPMWSGPRRLPVPMIAPAEEQPGSHVPPGLPGRRLTVPEPGGPDCYKIYRSEETTMPRYTIVQALAQARLADLHNQARRDELARAARRARRARRQHATRRATALLAALTRRARRPGPAPESPVMAPIHRPSGTWEPLPQRARDLSARPGHGRQHGRPGAARRAPCQPGGVPGDCGAGPARPVPALGERSRAVHPGARAPRRRPLPQTGKGDQGWLT